MSWDKGLVFHLQGKYYWEGQQGQSLVLSGKVLIEYPFFLMEKVLGIGVGAPKWGAPKVEETKYLVCQH